MDLSSINFTNIAASRNYGYPHGVQATNNLAPDMGTSPINMIGSRNYHPTSGKVSSMNSIVNLNLNFNNNIQ